MIRSQKTRWQDGLLSWFNNSVLALFLFFSAKCGLKLDLI